MLPKSTPIIIPDNFDLSDRFIKIKKSSFDYLEMSYQPGLQTTFRDDFVLLTILDILESLKTDLGFLQVGLHGFDFEEPKNLFDNTKTQLDLLLEKQKSLSKILVDGLGAYRHVRIENASLPSKEGVSVILEEIDKITDRFSFQEVENAVIQNNNMISRSIKNASDGRVQVVAELTNNHCGDTKRLYEMIIAAKAQGATLIKVQKRDPDSFYTREKLESVYKSPFGSTLGDYRRGVELSQNQFDFLTVTCAQVGIPWFCSVLDLPSLNFISRYSPILVKIPSTISNHKNFISKVAASTIPNVVVSLGGTNENYVTWIGDIFQAKNLFLMQCTSSYPADPNDLNIRVLSKLKDLANRQDLQLGYSSHDPGSLGSQLAISLGAVLIEKHVKYGDIEWIHFDGVALDLKKDEFRDFVNNLDQAVRILGKPEKQISDSENHKYEPNENAN
jgi:N-acetylneuraminate synthase